MPTNNDNSSDTILWSNLSYTTPPQKVIIPRKEKILNIKKDKISLIATGSQFPNKIQTAAKRPNPVLYSFLKNHDDFENSLWTNEKIHEALIFENWRTRGEGEVILEHDLIKDGFCEGICFEKPKSWINKTYIHEDFEMNVRIWTLEGAGKPQKPVVIRSTKEFKNIFSVPSKIQIDLPTEEEEAIRFFGCKVFQTEIMTQNGILQNYFCPLPYALINKKFRSAFSRRFPHFTKKYYREQIRNVLSYRNESNFNLKRGIKTKDINNIIYEGKKVREKWQPLHLKDIYKKIEAKYDISHDIIKNILLKRDYKPKNTVSNLDSFLDRMNNRNLVPDEYKYEKAIGIEIETLSPFSVEKAELLIPNFMRAGPDASIYTSDEVRAEGQNGIYGVEYKILINRTAMESKILKATDILNKLGVKVNKSCGLHIHLDMRHKNETEAFIIAKKLSKWIKILIELLPPARRNNKYCKYDCDLSDHHSAVSFPFRKYKTIEVRCHNSTTNPIKIIHWIKLLEFLIETPLMPPIFTISPLDALKMIGLPETEINYWTLRHQMLNKKQTTLDLSFLGNNPVEDEGPI